MNKRDMSKIEKKIAETKQEQWIKGPNTNAKTAGFIAGLTWVLETCKGETGNGINQ